MSQLNPTLQHSVQQMNNEELQVYRVIRTSFSRGYVQTCEWISTSQHSLCSPLIFISAIARKILNNTQAIIQHTI